MRKKLVKTKEDSKKKMFTWSPYLRIEHLIDKHLRPLFQHYHSLSFSPQILPERAKIVL